MTQKSIKISDLKNNTGQIKGLPKNPRILKDYKFEKLVKSIQDDPEMLDLRELIVYDNNGEMVVICGNMRLKAMKELKFKDAPCKVLPTGTDVEKLKAYTIKDNVAFGEHDFDILANEWDVEQLEEWGLDVSNQKESKKDGEIYFSNELDQESNYVVLKFNKDIDFLQIQTLLGLESTYSKRQNGKPWAKGIGRVVDGVDAIIKIKES